MVESDDCRGDHCGWVGVKPAGCQEVWVVWLGLYGLCGSAGASKRDDVWRRALP